MKKFTPRKHTSETLKEFFGKPLTMEEENKELLKMVNECGDRFEESQRENEELKEELLGCFLQACWMDTEKKYDHCCLSSYESAQALLIKLGLIKEDECYRK